MADRARPKTSAIAVTIHVRGGAGLEETVDGIRATLEPVAGVSILSIDTQQQFGLSRKEFVVSVLLSLATSVAGNFATDGIKKALDAYQKATPVVESVKIRKAPALKRPVAISSPKSPRKAVKQPKSPVRKKAR